MPVNYDTTLTGEADTLLAGLSTAGVQRLPPVLLRPIVLAAYRFAHAAHESVGQRRRYTAEPYVVHPVEVARLVSRYDRRDASLVAALLHDVLEDTGVEVKSIADEFGSEITKLVIELTDVTTHADGNRAYRKKLERERLARVSAQAKTIKLMDIVSNVRSIGRHDPKFAPTYLNEKALELEVLREGHPGALRLARTVLMAVQRRIAATRGPQSTLFRQGA